MTIHVGIDVGGTFTDAVAVSQGGFVRGKALSTDDVTGGILGALGVLQQRMGLSHDDFFSQVSRFVLGNTIVTNAIDQMKFAKVGLLTTRGFKDTLRIARSARGEERDPHDLAPTPQWWRGGTFWRSRSASTQMATSSSSLGGGSRSQRLPPDLISGPREGCEFAWISDEFTTLPLHRPMTPYCYFPSRGRIHWMSAPPRVFGAPRSGSGDDYLVFCRVIRRPVPEICLETP